MSDIGKWVRHTSGYPSGPGEIYAEDDMYLYIMSDAWDCPRQVVRAEFSEKGWIFIPNHTQVGGTHYQETDIQPWEVIERGKLDFWEGNAVKYIMRYKYKNGLEDLMKAMHYLEYLIQREADKENSNE